MEIVSSIAAAPPAAAHTPAASSQQTESTPPASPWSAEPASAVEPALRANDFRWPQGVKPGTILWGSPDGRTTTRLHFHAPEGKDQLRLTASQVHDRRFLWWDLADTHGRARVVNPTNMGITSRLTDLYDAVRQLDFAGAGSRRLPESYRAAPGELAVRLHGKQGYYLFDLAKDPAARALHDAATSAAIAVSVGEPS